MGTQRKGGQGLLVVFSEHKFSVLFHFWGSFALHIIILQALPIFLPSISPIFILIAFKLPMNVSHLDSYYSLSYLVFLTLVSPLFLTIFHAGWSNGKIWPHHFLLWLLQSPLIAPTKKSWFLSPAYKVLHSLISFSLFDITFYHPFIPRWNLSHMKLPVVPYNIKLYHAFLHLCLLSLQHTSFPTLPFVFQVKSCFSFSLLSCHFSVETSLILPGSITNCFFWAPLLPYTHLDWYFFHYIVVTHLCVSPLLDCELLERKEYLILLYIPRA